MLFSLLFLVPGLIRAEDLPFDSDDSQPDLPFQEDVPEDDQQDDYPEENTIESNEKEAAATPTPQPVPVPKPLSEIIGIPELVVALGFVLYLINFLVGKASVNGKIARVAQTLLPSLQRHFAVVPDHFEKRNHHTFDTWVSGRKGYQGALITQRFRKTCDPLGIALAVFQGESDTLIIEMLLKPRYHPALVFHVSKEKPYFADDMKLKSSTLGQKLQAWTDIGEHKAKFIKMVNDFMEQNPGVVQLIELADSNRFDTRDNNRFVAHFEFKVIGAVEDFMTDELVDFCVAMGDEFAVMKLPSEIQIRNERLREMLLKEREGQNTEKKLTPEEEEKQRKRRERREQGKFKPKIVMKKG